MPYIDWNTGNPAIFEGARIRADRELAAYEGLGRGIGTLSRLSRERQEEKRRRQRELGVGEGLYGTAQRQQQGDTPPLIEDPRKDGTLEGAAQRARQAEVAKTENVSPVERGEVEAWAEDGNATSHELTPSTAQVGEGGSKQLAGQASGRDVQNSLITDGILMPIGRAGKAAVSMLAKPLMEGVAIFTGYDPQADKEERLIGQHEGQRQRELAQAEHLAHGTDLARTARRPSQALDAWVRRGPFQDQSTPGTGFQPPPEPLPPQSTPESSVMTPGWQANSLAGTARRFRLDHPELPVDFDPLEQAVDPTNATRYGLIAELSSIPQSEWTWREWQLYELLDSLGKSDGASTTVVLPNINVLPKSQPGGLVERGMQAARQNLWSAAFDSGLIPPHLGPLADSAKWSQEAIQLQWTVDSMRTSRPVSGDPAALAGWRRDTWQRLKSLGLADADQDTSQDPSAWLSPSNVLKHPIMQDAAQRVIIDLETHGPTIGGGNAAGFAFDTWRNDPDHPLSGPSQPIPQGSGHRTLPRAMDTAPPPGGARPPIKAPDKGLLYNNPQR